MMNNGYVDPGYGYGPGSGSPYVNDYPVGIRGRRAARRMNDGYDRGFGGPISGPLVGGGGRRRRRGGPVSMLIGGVTQMIANHQDEKQIRESRSFDGQRSMGDPRDRMGAPQQQSRALTPDGRGMRLNTPQNNNQTYQRGTSRGRQLSDDEASDYEDQEQYDPAVAREYEKHQQNVGQQRGRPQPDWEAGPPPYSVAVNEKPTGTARRA